MSDPNSNPDDSEKPDALAAMTHQPSDEGSSAGQPSHIVGVGASAGGLEALELLFAHLSVHTGAAFVVVQHLSPDFKSLMDELLARHTAMTIHRVENGMRVEADCIYLIPPRTTMVISDGRLLLTESDPEAGLKLPIDIFLRSLAQDQQERAIAVILSGTGSDGARGIRDIHASGGIVLVQEPDSAGFDGMPRSAIDTGMVDRILTPQDIATAIVAAAESTSIIEHAASGATATASVDPRHAEIPNLLREHSGLDFTQYKAATIARRIERRIVVNRLSGLDEYARFVKDDPEEIDRLYHDLLIGVTAFFRDEPAFDLVKESVIDQLVNDAGNEDEIRVWVPGCASGEEAYTLAILFQEAMAASEKNRCIRIFATDVHERSLERAAAGVFTREAVRGVSQERLHRHFTARGEDSFQVSTELRKMVIFAPHNLIKDPPFTRIDLISCRNVLIYLRTAAQRKTISMFHFALKTHGAILLGTSEDVGDLNDEFDTLDRHWHLFRKRRDVRLPSARNVQMALPVARRVSRPATTRPAASGRDSPLNRAYDKLLSRHVAAGLLLDESYELQHVFGDAGRFLKQRVGRTTSSVLDLLNDELRMAISAAVHRSSKSNEIVSFENVRVTTNGQQSLVNLVVEPLPDERSGRSFYYLMLEDVEALGSTVSLPKDESEASIGEEQASEFRLDEHSAERIMQLERELQHSREHLQATIEELETSNEELQATNEELLASNEELQSTNEELHSVNEELYTVNAEHQRKIVELADLNNDMDNLLDSTDIATVFLDRDLRIRKFTPAVVVPFNLLPQDIGKPIAHISHNVDSPDLLEKVTAICEGGEPIEREVQTRNGQWLLMRILPYKENDRAAAGVVLTFTDIQELKKANERRLRSEQRFRRMFELNVIGVMFTDCSGNVVEANSAFLTMLGYSNDDLPLERDQIVPTEEREAEQSSRRVVEALGLTTPWESERVRKDGTRVPVLTGSARLEDEDDNEAGRTIVSFVLDLTDRKTAEAALADRNKLLALQNEQLDEFAHVASHDLQEPLRALSFFSQALTEDLGNDVPEAAAQDLKYIQDAAVQMHALVEDLLALSRAGRSGMKPQSLSLNESVDNALRNLSVRLKECNADLEIAELPDVDADPTLMTQLFQNLIANAIKFRGEATPQIRITCEEQGSDWIVSVRDNGIGIKADYLESIFEPFRRLHPRSRYKGSGIGLSICRKAVERHGGRIWVESTLGEGSCFKLQLSRQDSPASNSQADSASVINNSQELSND